MQGIITYPGIFGKASLLYLLYSTKAFTRPKGVVIG